MNDGLTLHRPLAALAFILALISSAAMPTMAQEITKPVALSMPEGWYPKGGIYAYRGKDFDVRCRDFGDLSIELARSRIIGNEVSCKVTKRTRIAPETLEIGLLCGDPNLAAHLNEPEEREFKEAMLLKKMSETTISVQKTVNGKFADPSAQAIYCPDEAQRKYKEMKRREQQAKKPEAAAKNASEKSDPKDGVYATPGADFHERCSKFDGLFLGLSGGSVSIGENKCNIFIRSDLPRNEIHLEMICNGRTGAKIMDLRKIDDRTIMIRDRNELTKADGPVAYCSEETQRAHREQRAGR